MLNFESRSLHTSRIVASSSSIDKDCIFPRFKDSVNIQGFNINCVIGLGVLSARYPFEHWLSLNILETSIEYFHWWLGMNPSIVLIDLTEFPDCFRYVEDLIEKIGKELVELKRGSIKQCERFLKKYEDVLHPHHFYMIDVKLALCQMYGHLEGQKLIDLTDDELNAKESLCLELLKLVDVLSPGSVSMQIHQCLADITSPWLYLISDRIVKKYLNSFDCNHRTDSEWHLFVRFNSVDELVQQFSIRRIFASYCSSVRFR